MKNQVLRAAFLNVVLLALVPPERGYAADLRSDTISAWDEYVHVETAKLQERVRPEGQFLWALENAERAAKVRGGEIVVAPAPGQNPRKVQGGLIHHWIGAAFVPTLKVDDILEVTRDYDHYKSYFTPSVVESKVVSLNGPIDKYSMLLMNKAFFMKTALDADYETKVVRLDACRVYAVSRTTRVQEIEDYGQPGAHAIPEGAGSGVIWKLYSVSRFQQRDGGVYVEVEGIALSREIPAMVRFMVDPIVRRVSRDALLMSLRQTKDAVQDREAVAARRLVVPSDGRQLGHMQSGFVGQGLQILQPH